MATIKDIAGLSGLSVATVSKYLNGKKLKEKNNIAIKSAIDELKYETNELARGLKINKTMTVGILIPEIYDEFGTQIISCIIKRLQESGYGSMVCMYGQDSSLEVQLNFARKKKVDGLIVMPRDDKDILINTVLERGVPVVLFDRLVSGVNCDAVVIDNEQAAFVATCHLLQKGHRRVGIICGFDNNYTAKMRCQGYKKAHEFLGIPILPELIYRSKLTVEDCVALSLAMLNSSPPSALLASNYYSALGFVQACKSRNIKIGQDISLVIFDDMPCFNLITPSITAVAQPLEQIGEQVVNLMLNRLSGDQSPPKLIELMSEFRPKDSVIQL